MLSEENKIYIFNFNDFIYRFNQDINNFVKVSNEEQQRIFQVGCSNSWINNIDSLYNNKDDKNTNLITELYNLLNKFNQNENCYLKFSNSNTKQLIINITPEYKNEVITSLTISTNNVSNNNFNSWLLNNDINNDEDIINILNKIKIQLFNTTIIVDFIHNILYSKFQKFYPVTLSDGSLWLDQNNKLSVNISQKENNKLLLFNSNNSDLGLYVE